MGLKPWSVTHPPPLRVLQLFVSSGSIPRCGALRRQEGSTGPDGGGRDGTPGPVWRPISRRGLAATVSRVPVAPTPTVTRRRPGRGSSYSSM